MAGLETSKNCSSLMVCSFAEKILFIPSKFFFFILVLGYKDQTVFPSMASFVYLVFGGRGALSSENVSAVLSTGNCLTINRAMQGRPYQAGVTKTRTGTC